MDDETELEEIRLGLDQNQPNFGTKSLDEMNEDEVIEELVIFVATKYGHKVDPSQIPFGKTPFEVQKSQTLFRKSFLGFSLTVFIQEFWRERELLVLFPLSTNQSSKNLHVGHSDSNNGTRFEFLFLVFSTFLVFVAFLFLLLFLFLFSFFSSSFFFFFCLSFFFLNSFLAFFFLVFSSLLFFLLFDFCFAPFHLQPINFI